MVIELGNFTSEALTEGDVKIKEVGVLECIRLLIEEAFNSAGLHGNSEGLVELTKSLYFSKNERVSGKIEGNLQIAI